MIKNIFAFLVIGFCAFLVAPKTFACMPPACMFSGHDQDTLILGEIVSESEYSRGVKILFLFPQNKIASLKLNDEITVLNFSKSFVTNNLESLKSYIGHRYLLALNRNENPYTLVSRIYKYFTGKVFADSKDLYIPAYRIYEITRTTFTNAKLMENKTVEDAAMQIFMNSGGTEQDFSFDYDIDKGFWRPTGEKRSIEIFPEANGSLIQEKLELIRKNSELMSIQKKKERIIWYGAGAGIVILLGGIALGMRKKEIV